MTLIFFRHFKLCAVRLAILAVLFGYQQAERDAGAAESAPEKLKTITRATDLLDLSKEEAKKEYPIVLRGIITCFDEPSRLCFVYDGTASVYVFTSSPLELIAGDVVDLAAVTGNGLFSPIALLPKITKIGHTNLPPAKPVAIDQLASGREDCQFVEVEGTVRSEVTVDQTRYIKLGGGSSPLQISLFQYPSTASPLLDGRVRIQGVAAMQYKNDLPAGVQLLVSTPEQVQIVEPAPADPFAAPIVSGQGALGYSRKSQSEHRVHLRGIVTFSSRNKTFYIRDDGGGIRVEAGPTDRVLQVGDLVDCVGFAERSSYAAVIRNAEFKILTNRVNVSPISVSVAQTISGKFENELVQLKARLVEVEPISPTESALLLESDQRIFRAFAPYSKEALNLVDDSSLALVGICSVPVEDGQWSDAFRLLLRDKADIAVLGLPLVRRKHAIDWLLGGVALTALFGIFLQRQTRHRNRALITHEKQLQNVAQEKLEREIAARKEMEQQLRLREQQLKASIDERERIARDLHDELIQSIYAIGLNIEDCSCSVPPAAPEIRNRLGKIKSDLNRVIEEVRNFILGIESSTVTGTEFKTALKSMVLTMAESQRGKVRIDVDRRAAEELTPDQATQLLHVAREAMTNSLRHSEAGLIVFSLLRHGSRIRFEVKDDGKGFNVNLPSPRGLGLRNMATRAAEMGADYTLVSEIGSGARIVLDFEPKNAVASSP